MSGNVRYILKVRKSKESKQHKRNSVNDGCSIEPQGGKQKRTRLNYQEAWLATN